MIKDKKKKKKKKEKNKGREKMREGKRGRRERWIEEEERETYMRKILWLEFFYDEKRKETCLMTKEGEKIKEDIKL